MIGVGGFLGKPWRFFAAAAIAQKFVNVVKPRPREHALPARMTELLVQPQEQLAFDLVARREVTMTSLAGERAMIFAVPIKSRLAESGARGNHRLIADSVGRTGIEHGEIFFRQRRDSECVSFEIVDEAQGRDPGRLRQQPRIDDPREVRRFRASVAYRSCDSKAGMLDLRGMRGDE